MIFSSMTFIFLFFPIVCLCHFFLKKEWQNLFLLISSFFFYAWGEPKYLAIMILTICINYLGALALDKWQNFNRKIILWIIISLNISFLFYFKYINFVFEIFGNFITNTGNSNTFIDVVMPIGISFYTFQAISYIIDVYRKEVSAQKNIYHLALYISFFPQLIAGPIVKYHDIVDQINQRDVTFRKVEYGIKRFIIGLSKKVLIANVLGEVATQIFALQPMEAGTLLLWLGALCFMFQIYYDFSGYSDMAIGLGAIFGFKFLENFNYPYISKSITEFWRRWHISLSTWFREYVYIPLGGNRVSPYRVYCNLGIVFFLTGFWHGASWNFIFWGLWNGFFIIIEKMTGYSALINKNKWLIPLQYLYTLIIVLFGWVLFQSTDLTHALQYLLGMFGYTNEIIYENVEVYLSRKEYIILFIATISALPLFQRIIEISLQGKLIGFTINICLLLLFVLSVSSIAASTFNPFIYFRF